MSFDIEEQQGIKGVWHVAHLKEVMTNAGPDSSNGVSPNPHSVVAGVDASAPKHAKELVCDPKQIHEVLKTERTRKTARISKHVLP